MNPYISPFASVTELVTHWNIDRETLRNLLRKLKIKPDRIVSNTMLYGLDAQHTLLLHLKDTIGNSMLKNVQETYLNHCRTVVGSQALLEIIDMVSQEFKKGYTSVETLLDVATEKPELIVGQLVIADMLFTCLLHLASKLTGISEKDREIIERIVQHRIHHDSEVNNKLQGKVYSSDR
jgi:hypothetical protein